MSVSKLERDNIINSCVCHGTTNTHRLYAQLGDTAMNIYDPIASILGIPPIELPENYHHVPEDATFSKWAHGSIKSSRFNSGRPKGTFENYIFVTNGTIEKIVHKDLIPDGMSRGRLRVCNPLKPITINGITYSSGNEAAEKLNLSKSMISYMRNKMKKCNA